MEDAAVEYMGVEVENSHQYSINFVAVRQQKSASQTGIWHEMPAKMCCLILLWGEKSGFADIHCHLLNIYGYQTMNVSTVTCG